MKPVSPVCHPNWIDDYLYERLNDQQTSEFESHLAVCDQCRCDLDSRAADPHWWAEAKELLGDTETFSTESNWGHGAASIPTEPGDSAGKSDQLGAESWQANGILDMLAPTDDPEMLGRLGDYEIMGVVGVGGMGAVLKGFDKSLRRVVAIKIMAPHLAGSGPARARFRREAQAAAAITHDCVIDIYGVAEAGGLPYLVMPYARGPSLQTRIDRGGPLTATEVLSIGRQIASGLAAAHEQGVVHRDIKPANILLNDGIERLLITDFGVARAMDDASMTKTGVIAGTPQYMSPEQARGEAVDRRSDLFSLGSVLYTACTGRAPFRSEAAYGILRRIIEADPRPIAEINPDVPHWLCRIIDRLMSKHPADRYETAAEVAELLEICLAHVRQPDQVALPGSLNSTVAPATTKQAVSRPRFHRFVRIGVASMIGSLILAGLSLVVVQVTDAPDISGPWQGEAWSTVSLSNVSEAENWVSGGISANGTEGTLQLQWSRLQQRFNGEWRVGEDYFGTITLRLDSHDNLRGALAVDARARVTAETPRLRDFVWKRSSGAPKSPDLAVQSDAREADADKQAQIANTKRTALQNQQRLTEAFDFGMSPANLPLTFGPASDLAKRLNGAAGTIQSMQANMQRCEAELATHQKSLTYQKQQFESLKSELAEADPKVQQDVKEKLAKLASKLEFTQSRIQATQTRREAGIRAMQDAKATLAEVETERDTILELLRSRQDAIQASYEHSKQLFESIREQHEAGLVSNIELLRAKQASTDSAAQIKQMEVLIEFYLQLGRTN